MMLILESKCKVKSGIDSIMYMEVARYLFRQGQDGTLDERRRHWLSENDILCNLCEETEGCLRHLLYTCEKIDRE